MSESTLIIDECCLRPKAIMTLLDISECTFYRWKRSGQMPRSAWLVLRSVAQGLPVLPSRSHQWELHRFGRDGALYTPTGYPIYPYDLWVFEFANKNGILRLARSMASTVYQDAIRTRPAANDVGPLIA